MSWLKLLREHAVRYLSPSRFAGRGLGVSNCLFEATAPIPTEDKRRRRPQ